MTMTVKKLIAELEKIDNKFLEIECMIVGSEFVSHEIDHIGREGKRIIIFTRENDYE